MQKQVIFKDNDHKAFYQEKIMEYTKQGRTPDSYVKPLFYLLSISEDTRREFDNLYNMTSGSIKPDGIKGDWLTGTTKKVCLLAFNLFNGRTQEGRKKVSEELTPYELFANEYALYFMQAIKLRYPSYFATRGEV